MMRIAVFVLIAANLLYLGWSRWVGDDETRLTAVAATGTAPRAAPAQPAAAPPPPCASLGPFIDDALAQQAQQKLEAAGWGVLRRTVNEESRQGWWVHVPNADAARQVRTLNAIRRAGINDAFAMPDDPEFTVSVGVFSEEARAEDRAAQVQRLKLDALVSERRQSHSAVWFDVPGVARETLSDGRLAATGIALDMLRVEACPAPVDAAPAPAVPAEAEAAAAPTASSAP